MGALRQTLVVIKVRVLDPYWQCANAARIGCAHDMQVPIGRLQDDQTNCTLIV